MSEWVEIELPYPPSVNTYWRHTKAGRHYISKKGREFKEVAIARCKAFDAFSGAVKIRMDVYFPDKRKRDLDNLTKGVFDSLVASGLIEDDNNEVITEYAIRSAGVVKNGKLMLKIKGVQ